MDDYRLPGDPPVNPPCKDCGKGCGSSFVSHPEIGLICHACDRGRLDRRDIPYNRRKTGAEADVLRLLKEVERLKDKVTAVTNEKIDLFSKWTRGVTFKEWQNGHPD